MKNTGNSNRKKGLKNVLNVLCRMRNNFRGAESDMKYPTIQRKKFSVVKSKLRMY